MWSTWNKVSTHAQNSLLTETYYSLWSQVNSDVKAYFTGHCQHWCTKWILRGIVHLDWPRQRGQSVRSIHFHQNLLWKINAKVTLKHSQTHNMTAPNDLSALFFWLRQRRGFDHFHIWHVASFIRTDFKQVTHLLSPWGILINNNKWYLYSA